MKKNISIEKKIDFSSMIGEVSAISLEHNLKFISNDEIAGDLVVCGRYKATAASQIEEDFNEKIPVSISLMEKVDVENAKVDIVDFYYDVLDNASLNCNIELLVDALELIDDGLDDNDVREAEVSEEDRECDGDPVDTKEIEIPKIENTNVQDNNIIENIEVKNNINTNIDINTEERTEEIINNSKKSEIEVESENVEITEEEKASEVEEDCENLFFNFDSSKETYGTFVVYIVRQNETINTIIEKYNTTVEEIEKYNDIKDISIGSKLIIPLLNEKD